MALGFAYDVPIFEKTWKVVCEWWATIFHDTHAYKMSLYDLSEEVTAVCCSNKLSLCGLWTIRLIKRHHPSFICCFCLAVSVCCHGFFPLGDEVGIPVHWRLPTAGIFLWARLVCFCEMTARLVPLEGGCKVLGTQYLLSFIKQAWGSKQYIGRPRPRISSGITNCGLLAVGWPWCKDGLKVLSCMQHLQTVVVVYSFKIMKWLKCLLVGYCASQKYLVTAVLAH